MLKLRLSPFATLIPASSGLLVRSDLGFFQIGGPDMESFMSRLVPLLDGSRDRAALLRSLPDYSPESILSLLDALEKHGLIEPADASSRGSPRRGQEEFFSRWPGSPGEHQARLARSRVLVVGLEPWGAVCAVELASAGVGALELVDGGRVTTSDLSLSGVWETNDVGSLRRSALSRSIRKRAPSCRVITRPLKISAAGRLVPPRRAFDLVVAVAHADDLRTLLGAARFAHHAGMRSLFASVEGLDAVLGPAVIPDVTACWNCYRLRSLAHANPSEETHELQAALLKRVASPRLRTYLGPMLPLLGHLVALEAIKILSGYAPSKLFGRVIVQNLVSLETTTHTLIRMPWCEVCGGAAASKPEPGGGSKGDRAGPPEAAQAVADARDPAELRQALAGWVDERVGVIRRLAPETPDPRGPELPFTSRAVLAAYTEGQCDSAELEISSGRGLALVDAMRGAAAEGLERYSAARYRKSELRRCSLNELDEDAMDPRQLFFYATERYAEAGFPFAPFRPTQPLEWVPGSWVDTGEPVWVPALCAYHSYDVPQNELFGQVTSNGLAAGRDFKDAALRALLELVERDAFMLTWLASLPARQLDIQGSLDPAAGEIVRQLEEQGAVVRLYLLDIGHTIPVVASVSYGDGRRWPGAAIALGCHLSLRTAATRAILEQGQASPHLRALLEAGEGRIPAAPDEVVTLTDHALYYFPLARAGAFDFLRRGELPPLRMDEMDEPREISLAECASRLSRVGLRPAVVDVTSPDLRGGPFRVARALGPWFQPVDFGHRLRRLANPRLWRLVAAPNPDPHPLA